MGRRVVFSPRAEAHLDSIHRWIAERSGLLRADAFVERLLAHCRTLFDFPERGIRRDDLFPNLRIIGFRRQATVAFTVEEGTVTNQGLLARGRDLSRALEVEEG